jgi:hypothetical protein
VKNASVKQKLLFINGREVRGCMTSMLLKDKNSAPFIRQLKQDLKK